MHMVILIRPWLALYIVFKRVRIDYEPRCTSLS